MHLSLLRAVDLHHGQGRDPAGGAEQAYYTDYDAQRRYDIAYLQCMYSKGNQLPGSYPSRQGTGAAPVLPPPAGIQPAPPVR